VPVSTGIDRASGAAGQTIIKDVSSTGAFVTESSLVRRNAVQVSSSGIQTALAGRVWQVALIGEHVRLDATDPQLKSNPIGSRLPASVFASSVAGMLLAGPWRMAAEATLPSGNAPSWRAALRWRHSSTSGMILDMAHTNQRVTSPYSGRNRLFADHDSELTIDADRRSLAPIANVSLDTSGSPAQALV